MDISPELTLRESRHRSGHVHIQNAGTTTHSSNFQTPQDSNEYLPRPKHRNTVKSETSASSSGGKKRKRNRKLEYQIEEALKNSNSNEKSCEGNSNNNYEVGENGKPFVVMNYIRK